MERRPYIRDLEGLNLMYLNLMREVANADYGEAMSLFGIDSTMAQRVARSSLEDLVILSSQKRPLMTFCDNRGVRAELAQIEARASEDRIDLSRLSSVLQQAADNVVKALSGG